MLKIEEMFAFIAEEGPGEGITGFKGPLGWMPMVGADMARVESLKAKAQEIANASGMKIRLVKFSTRTELEEILPLGKN